MIAYNDLKENDPQTLAKAEALLATLNEYFLEDQHAFIESATWPDDIKGMQWKAFNSLHFLNTPVIDPSYEGEVEIPADNAITLFEECMKTLNYASGETTAIGKSLCVRFIIHIVGDVHQPLHTATLFSDKFQDGDMGGNKFLITYPKKKSLKQLHGFWDYTANKYSSSIKVPLNDAHYERLQGYAANITEVHNRSTLKTELKVKSFEDWCKESGKHALETAYDNLNLKSGDTITEEYDNAARELIDKQLALGGYRLADSLKQVLKVLPDSIVQDFLEETS